MPRLAAALFALATLLVGGGITLQAALNTQLRQWLGHPVVVAIASFAVGLAALAAVAAAGRLPLPSAQEASGAPWWAWTGGLFGALYVAASVVLAPRLGPGLFFALLVAGQLVAAVVIEHFGLLGFDPQPASPVRVLGVALLVVGVLLIRRGG